MIEEDPKNQASKLGPEFLPYLHYDTVFYLSFTAQETCILTSQGFLINKLEAVMKDKFEGDSNECLFRLLPMASFKTHQKVRDLFKVLKEGGVSKEKKSMLSNMLESEAPRLENESYSWGQDMQKASGKFVDFNTPVQFQHVMSHKFLTLKTNEAIGFSESLLFTLEESPSEDSILKLLPSFKFQTENQKYVRFDQEIYISNHGKPESHYMHVKNYEASKEKAGEHVFVTGNHKLKTKIQLHLNRPSMEPLFLANNLFYGDMIWLIHAEHSAQLYFDNASLSGDDRMLQISRNLKALGNI